MKVLILLISLLASGWLFAAPETPSGEVLFKAKCIICHQEPEPAMLTENQWRVILPRMNKRMRLKGIPEIPADELARIESYLRQHARK